MTKIWSRIRKRKTKVKGHNYSYWILDGGVIDGHRVYRNFKTKKEALFEAQKLRIERNKIGEDALRLNEKQKKEAVLAYKKLNGRATLLEAVETFLRHLSQDGAKRSVKEVLEEYPS